MDKLLEVRGLKTDGYLGQKVGNILHLEEGTIAGNKMSGNAGSKDRRWTWSLEKASAFDYPQ